jgi:hypothetical protein
MHWLVSVIAPAGHGPDWLWLLIAFFVVMAIRSYLHQRGDAR